MTQAVAYLRVSTDGQTGEDRFGLADQRATIEAFAQRQGLEVVEWYSDEGISGATLDRPALHKMLHGASQGAFKTVVVAKMDRVARDLLAALWIEKELLKTDVELVSASEPFRGQDPANVLFRQIIAAFAQFEKSRITERMTGGRRQKANRGGYAGGSPAIGYTATRGSKALHVDADKAETVRRVFQLRSEQPGLSLRQIAAILNREGHTTAHGTPFQATQVKRILDRREFYSGTYRYSGITTEGVHKAILQEDNHVS